MLSFEIWNHNSGNAVADFDTVADALNCVREELLANGRDYADDWTLIVTDGETMEPIVAGEHLARLAVRFESLDRGQNTPRAREPAEASG